MKSVAQLRAALDALDSTVAETQSKADSIALDAISGNADARRELADLLRKIDQAEAERPIICAALDQAAQAEAEARRDREEAQRAAAMSEAAAHHSRLLELSRTVDEIQSRFLPVLAELAEAERGVWQKLRAAGLSPSTSFVGRHDIAGLAFARLGIAASGKALFHSDRRSIEEICRAAWAEIFPAQAQEKEPA